MEGIVQTMLLILSGGSKEARHAFLSNENWRIFAVASDLETDDCPGSVVLEPERLST